MADRDPDSSPIDEDVLDAVTEAMVALHQRYHGRRPMSARTRMLGGNRLPAGDVYTDTDKTMIELQRQAMVHEIRSAFQQASARPRAGTLRARNLTVTGHRPGGPLLSASTLLGVVSGRRAGVVLLGRRASPRGRPRGVQGSVA
jgi:hypothetical protein